MKRPEIIRTQEDPDYGKRFVDMVCDNRVDDIIGECDKLSLQRYAKLNGIPIGETDTKRGLCLKIAFKYEKDALVKTLSDCQQNIDELVSAVYKGNGGDIDKDVLELQSWWNKHLMKAQSSIDTEDVTKVREYKNLIRQTCNTFVQGVRDKSSKQMKSKVSFKTRASRWFS